MAICVVSGAVLDPSGTALSGTSVSFNTQLAAVSAEPVQGSTSTASDGSWSLSLLQGISGIFTIPVAPTTSSRKVLHTFSAVIPATSTATFSSTLVGS